MRPKNWKPRKRTTGPAKLKKVTFYVGKVTFYVGKVTFYVGKVTFYVGTIFFRPLKNRRNKPFFRLC